MLKHPQSEYRPNQIIWGDASGDDEEQFRPGGAITKNGSIYTIIPVASGGKFRMRFEASVGGTMVSAYLKPGITPGLYKSFYHAKDGSDPVTTTGNPADVTVTADTEALLEINDLSGEAYLLVKFTEANVAAGTVTSANICQL
jgi:hypothetical protein